MKLRISHYPQIPCKPFKVDVKTLEEGLLLIEILSNYDLFQFQNKIKPDYCNSTTFECWDEEDQEWLSWCDEEGYEIEDYELKDGKAVLRLREDE
jgi:hypothetical protein